MVEEPWAVFIDGGTTFKTREEYLEFLRKREISLESRENWSEGNYLETALDLKLVRTDMPCTENARYEEWKITFERYLQKLPENLVLIGYSLGGIFLVKYLSENDISKNIISLNLVAPPFDDSLPEEDLAGGFKLGEDLTGIREKVGKNRLFFSEDDNVVPVRHAEKYREELEDPEINIHEDMGGHFQVEKFPELVQKINGDLK